LLKPLHKYIALCVICVISFLLQFKTLNQFPQYIHSWAQCDRYALALGFIDNGGDFFHPQTYVMNNQFPGEFMVPRQTTITSVDFPIHDYVVSFVMRIANSTEPWCFRLYVLLYSMAGLYFLYKLTALFTPSLTRGLFVVLFALSSPVFLYYQAGFLPTIPSLANAMIGLYFFVYFLKTQQRKFFYFCLLFVTLAALARLPFAIMLVAIGCFEAFYVLKSKRLDVYKVLGFVLAIACIIGYYIYNGYLRKQYGSLFLNYIIPATSVSDFTEFSKTALKKWSFQYFNILSDLLFAVAALVGIYNTLRNRKSFTALEKQFLFLICIILCGCSSYYVLMCYQFMNHDYYFLDTFYLPLVGLFLFFVVKWPQLSIPRPKLLGALSLLVFVPVLLFSREKLQERMNLSYTAETSTADNYKGADRLLDSLHIPKDAKLLVFGNEGSNNAFILLKRKGFVIIEPDSAKIATALQWPYDYIVADDEAMISRVYAYDPSIIDKIRRIGGNGKISVYLKDKFILHLTEKEFFGLDRRKPSFEGGQYFETPVPGIRRICRGGCFGNSSAVMDSVTEYGYTVELHELPVLKTKASLLYVSCRFKSVKVTKDLLLCVSLKSDGKELLFKAQPMLADADDWKRAVFLLPLPKVREGRSELKVFIWNQGKNNLTYDDFEVTIY
jgi:hypothetical protein